MRVQIRELRVYIHELRVQIHKLRQKQKESRTASPPQGTHLYILTENLTGKEVIIQFFSGTKRRDEKHIKAA